MMVFRQLPGRPRPAASPIPMATGRGETIHRDRERKWERGVLAALVVCALIASMFAASLRNLPTWVPTLRAKALPEPDVAARFVTAYAGADEATIATLESPLYRAELRRRGYGDRLAFTPVPWSAGADPVLPWLRFTYVDGVVDRQGYTHLLYTARSLVVDESSAPLTVWRVDLDAQGQIIWAEMVFGFGAAPSYAVQRTNDVRLAELPPIPVPLALKPIWPRLHPLVLLTLTSSDGQRYFILGLTEQDSMKPHAPRPEVMLFFAQDEAGHVFRDSWSFGDRRTGANHDTAVLYPPAHPIAGNDRGDPTWENYIGTLW